MRSSAQPSLSPASRGICPLEAKPFLYFFVSFWVAIGTACYRTEKARIPPKVLGIVLGGVPGKRGLLGALLGAVPFLCFSRESGLPALLPAVLPAVLFFPALFPALSPALLGDSGFLSPVAGGPDYNFWGWSICSERHFGFVIVSSLSGLYSLWSVHRRMVHGFPLHLQGLLQQDGLCFPIRIFIRKQRENASFIHSIHANTFTPFTRVVATGVRHYMWIYGQEHCVFAPANLPVDISHSCCLSCCDDVRHWGNQHMAASTRSLQCCTSTRRGPNWVHLHRMWRVMGWVCSSQGRANHEVQTVNWNTGIFEAESA